MDLLGLIADISKDADPSADGFQPQPPYVILNIALPLATALVVAGVLAIVERVLGIGANGDVH